MARALMHTALTRARLMEVLAKGLVDAAEYDNLFITGAFSMLDALLGVSMDQALESMSLPEAITDALRGDTIRYKKVLAGILLDLQERAFEYLKALEVGGAELEPIVGLVKQAAYGLLQVTWCQAGLIKHPGSTPGCHKLSVGSGVVGCRARVGNKDCSFFE